MKEFEDYFSLGVAITVLEEWREEIEHELENRKYKKSCFEQVLHCMFGIHRKRFVKEEQK